MNDHAENPEARRIFRATIRDAISRERIERYAFSAETIEEARQRAWRHAGRYGGDVDVTIEPISQ